MSAQQTIPKVDCLIVGAGVIGLAIARALALAGLDVLVIERESRFGSQTSSRNSEVIHAGVYYEPGSLKAQACVEGAKHLYRYCEERGIRHRRCGKLIVATDLDQAVTLEKLESNARACGVIDLEWLTPSAVRAMEPSLNAAAVLHSPSTGILDSHEYMLSLLGEAEGQGASIAYDSCVESIDPSKAGFDIVVKGNAMPAVTCRWVINAAGLDATRVATCIDGFPRQMVPPLFYAKGSYFALSGKAPFSRLIYPVPSASGLGVHLTVDLAGQARFGPDVEWVDRVDYEVDPLRADGFYSAIRLYWPGLESGRLHPSYAGVRPKLSGPGEAAVDFLIAGPTSHGMAGLVHLFGIESPGLTASLDIAQRVLQIVQED